MPNHITNILVAPAEVLAALKGESLVDFNVVIPQPSTLETGNVYAHVEGMAELICGKIPVQPKRPSDLRGVTDSLRLSNVLRDIQEGGITKWKDNDFEMFVTILRSYRACGAFSWYSWNLEHWGTKWNAYEIEWRSETCIKFETAWSAPHPIISVLASRFPQAKMLHEWADEDIGSNLGRRGYFGPVRIDQDIDDPIDFALTLTGSEREGYRQNEITGRWEYADPDEDQVG